MGLLLETQKIKLLTPQIITPFLIWVSMFYETLISTKLIGQGYYLCIITYENYYIDYVLNNK